jgi:hypothetical protein
MKGRTVPTWCATAALLLATSVPFAPQALAQHGHDNHGNRGNYYSGMRGSVNRGDYNRNYVHDDHRDHNSGGGIGPGYGALIGGGGGAALGAVFGGGLKGTLIGGAAGAALGALGGKLAQDSGNDHHNHGHSRGH